MNRRGMGLLLVIVTVAVTSAVGVAAVHLVVDGLTRCRRAELEIHAQRMLAAGQAWVSRHAAEVLAWQLGRTASLDVSLLAPADGAGTLELIRTTAVRTPASSDPHVVPSLLIRATASLGKLRAATSVRLDLPQP